MGFFSKIRAFLNAKAEILDRLDTLERSQKKTDLALTDLDDFMHRLARRRIAKGEERFDPGPDENVYLKPPAQDQPPETSLTKQQLWNLAKQKFGVTKK